MTAPYSPPFVTETDEPPPWTDCMWAAALMLANKARKGGYPATRAEREALRKASGDHVGGSNLDNVTDGIQERYGWTLNPLRPSWSGLLTALAHGAGVLACGRYALLTPHFTRWDRKFAAKANSNHAVYVQGHDRGGNFHLGADGIPDDVFWCDPLGRSPKGTPAAQRYRGEWMPAGIFHDFVRGLGTDARLYCAIAAQGSIAAASHPLP